MFDTRMIGIPNCPEKGMVVIDLPRDWIQIDSPPFRQAYVGEPVLIYVAVLSAAEVKAVNSQYKKRQAEILRTNLETKGPDYQCQHLEEIALNGARKIDEMLEMIEQEGYFSSWVVIEACTID